MNISILFVSKKQLKHNYSLKILNFLKYWLWLESYLKGIIFEKRIFVFQISQFKSFNSLIFFYVEKYFLQIVSNPHKFSFIVLVTDSWIWRISKYSCYFCNGSGENRWSYCTSFCFFVLFITRRMNLNHFFFFFKRFFNISKSTLRRLWFLFKSRNKTCH